MADDRGAALEALRYNARIRAWRIYGLPIEGKATFTADRGYISMSVVLECRECGESRRRGFAGTIPTPRDLLWQAQSFAIQDLAKCGCTHLASVAGGDPEMVIEITKLEILAGE